MDDLLTDQQQAERVRGWLQENVWYLIGGLVLGLGALFGWREWQNYRTTQAAAASATYEELLGAVRAGRTARAEELAAQLARDYAGTPYLDQARLAMARLNMDRSKPDEAVIYLRQVAEEGHSEEMRHIARLRLARVLVEQQKYEEALKWLEVPQDSAFAARFHEVRGDVYHAMGRFGEAREEYLSALNNGDAGVIDAALVQAKLDDLGLGSESAAPANLTKTAPPAGG